MHTFVLEGKMLRSLIGRNLFITGTQLRGNLTAFLFKHFFSQSYHLPADMLNETWRKNSVTISMQINILESSYFETMSSLSRQNVFTCVTSCNPKLLIKRKFKYRISNNKITPFLYHPLYTLKMKKGKIYIRFQVFQNFVNQYASSKNKVIEMVNNINAQICQTVLKIERE